MITIHLGARGLQELIDRVTQIEKRLKATGTLKRQISKLLLEQTRRRFKTKTDPDGAAWAPWSDNYAATRSARHSLLIDSRALLNSIKATTRQTGVAVTSDRVYAARQNAVRTFLGMGEQDTEQLEKLVDKWMERL